MPSSKEPQVAAQQAQRDVKDELSKLDIGLVNQIYATDDPVYAKLDTNSVFAVAENIRKHATQIVDRLLGTHVRGSTDVPVDTYMEGTQAYDENLEQKTPRVSLCGLSCILKRLSSEMACPDESTPVELPISILRKASRYSWDAKAVLTFAAFALEYRNFWFAQRHSTELPESVGILNHIHAILDLQKYQNVIDELQSLIKATPEFIKHIVEFEKKTIHGKKVQELQNFYDRIPKDVYWGIRTILACTTQMSCLGENENKTDELSISVTRINGMLDSLKGDIGKYKIVVTWPSKRWSSTDFSPFQ